MRRTFWAKGSRLEEACALWTMEEHTDAQIAEILTEKWGIDVTGPMVQGARARYGTRLERAKKLLAGGLGSDAPKTPAVTPLAASPRPPAPPPPPPPEEDFEIDEEGVLDAPSSFGEIRHHHHHPSTQRDLDANVQIAPKPQQPVGPVVHTSKSRGEAYLVVSDTQEPYSAPAALAFVLAVAREYDVDLKEAGRAYHVGDEVDFLNFSRFLRSPEAPHTPNQELQAIRDRLRSWYAAIPHFRLCKSNHGDRILRRAMDAGLPSQLLRAHRDVLEAPPTWEWANDWRVQATKQHFLVEHGHHGGQSTAASRQRPAWNGISTAWGHMHAQAGVWHVRTHGQQVWGMCVGSLIDRDAVAFEYGKPNTWQPWLGVGVVLDGGRTPILVPYGGNWP